MSEVSLSPPGCNKIFKNKIKIVVFAHIDRKKECY